MLLLFAGMALSGCADGTGGGTHNRTCNIKAFLDYLVGQGYLTDAEYMTGIHLGNEVWYGSGEVYIRNYAAAVR
jgi:hypothetical protein